MVRSDLPLKRCRIGQCQLCIDMVEGIHEYGSPQHCLPDSKRESMKSGCDQIFGHKNHEIARLNINNSLRNHDQAMRIWHLLVRKTAAQR